MAENRGLCQKFNVFRKDGKNRPNAAYFVLDVVNDKFALVALQSYADACRDELPELASDLDLLINGPDRTVLSMVNKLRCV